jgi:hypothetical protein
LVAPYLGLQQVYHSTVFLRVFTVRLYRNDIERDLSKSANDVLRQQIPRIGLVVVVWEEVAQLVLLTM